MCTLFFFFLWWAWWVLPYNGASEYRMHWWWCWWYPDRRGINYEGFWVSGTVHFGTDLSEVKCTVTSEIAEMSFSDFRRSNEVNEKFHTWRPRSSVRPSWSNVNKKTVGFCVIFTGVSYKNLPMKHTFLEDRVVSHSLLWGVGWLWICSLHSVFLVRYDWNLV